MLTVCLSAALVLATGAAETRGLPAYALPEFADAGLEVRVRRPDASPFAFVDVRPAGAPRKVGTVKLPAIRLTGFAVKPVAMGTDGLGTLDAADPSCAFVAVAEPWTRRGVVASWTVNHRGVGAFAAASGADGSVLVTPIVDYGPMPPEKDGAWDTFVIGSFDDCRLGLEASADEAARANGVKLPPNRTGYCTWCSDRYGCAGTEASTRQFADAAVRLLKPYGFDFIQIDDQWQSGVKKGGRPARDYRRPDPEGPYPNGFRPVTDHLSALGLTTGLWFIPFAGVPDEPAWAGCDDLYVTGSVTHPKSITPDFKKDLVVIARQAGEPLATWWAGAPLDMTNPKARALLAEEVRRFTHDWGMRYLKCDGISSGFACDVYGGYNFRDQNFAEAVFHDPGASNVQNYRLGFETIRKAAAPGTFILGCNLGTARAIVPSFGVVDGMRISHDNGPIDSSPDWYILGVQEGSRLYFYNGRVWRADPDSTYVRAATSLGRARSMATWTGLTDSLYEVGDWLPDLPGERVELLRRTMAHHGVTSVRPIDYFENDLPTSWILDGGAHKVIGVFNWDTEKTLKADYPFAYAGLDPEKTYAGWDFWRNEPFGPVKGNFALEVPPDDCRVIQLAEVSGDAPVLVSTSRHVASPVFDLRNPKAADVPGEKTIRRWYSPKSGFQVQAR